LDHEEDAPIISPIMSANITTGIEDEEEDEIDI
jgi:hypothetical protein